MFSTEVRVGKLYEHRILAIDSDDEIGAVKARGMEVMRAQPGKVVVCSDYRQIKFLKRELTDRFVDMLRALSPSVERSGILITPDQAVFHLQITRMVRETGFASRHVCHDEAELQAWLGEALTPPEQARLSAFLAEGRPR